MKARPQTSFEQKVLDIALITAKYRGLEVDEQLQSHIETEIRELISGTDIGSCPNGRRKLEDLDVLGHVFPAGLPDFGCGIDDETSPQVARNDARIIGNSEAIKAAVGRALGLACTNARVLIHGESGTGRGQFARLIHDHSVRRDNAFIEVHCEALDPNFALSDLFGNRFAEAESQAQIGKVEAADGGTLYLSEVTELPASAQAALLRLLDTGEIQPTGCAFARKIDVRVISSTKANLREEVLRGNLKPELFYRLFSTELLIPSLRDRKEDIPEISRCLLKKMKMIYGKKTPAGFAVETEKLLCAYDWPGNVRQLEQVIERTVLECDSEFISVDDIAPNLGSFTNHFCEVPREIAEFLAETICGAIGPQSNLFVSHLVRTRGHWFTTSSVAEATGMSESCMRVKLRGLAAAGVLAAEGDRRGRRYRLADELELDFPSKNSDINRLGEPD